MNETAYAKINLALHVRRRRKDGYHELETLFAFVDVGDRLKVAPTERDHVWTLGEFGGALSDPFDNIVAKALTALPRQQGWSVTLEKNLPVAAGLGGGSADAGALFRLVERAQGLPDDWPERALKLGADVPACVRSEACVGRGVGELLEPVENDMAGMPVLLVNPRIAISTAAVFSKWDGNDSGPLLGDSMQAMTLLNGNSLQEIAVCNWPQVTEVLNALDRTHPEMRRMSGSGATCFGIYRSQEAREAAFRLLSEEHSEWWYLQGNLR
jgi:4-diphosphocytidyl-2-C-methyl-D-erythritol kinase